MRDEPQYLEWTELVFYLVEKCESAKLKKYIIARCDARSGAGGGAHPGYTKISKKVHLPIY